MANEPIPYPEENRTQWAGDVVDTTDERIAVVCMIVSNPGGTPRADDWKKQVNDLIRALRDERNDLRKKLIDAVTAPQQ